MNYLGLISVCLGLIAVFIAIQYMTTSEKLFKELKSIRTKCINVDKSNMGGAEAQSKLIRISLLTPNLGGGISSLKELNRSDFAWSIFSPKETDNSYQIIFDDKNLSPWKLIKKN